MSNLFSTMSHWKSGRLRLIAHAGSRRLEALPDLPTIAESGVPGYEAVNETSAPRHALNAWSG